MKHLGDICRINGGGIAPVDVIIGGSPCQDLSIAGKRQGLSGERSGLFMEQIRLIKEMHEVYGTYSPRYMVWENVPGALSSNKGEDFRIVLESIAAIKEPNAIIPQPPKGKWNNNGCILGAGWSIAWRILDAQFWGVPQRRRRIALIADFGGESAPEILFERKSVSRNSQKSGDKGKSITRQPQNSSYPTIAMRIRGRCEGGRNGVICLNDQGGQVMNVNHDVSGTLRAQMGGRPPVVLASGQANAEVAYDLCPTLQCIHDKPILCQSTESFTLLGENICSTLQARDYKGVGRVDTFGRVICQYQDTRSVKAYSFDSMASNSMKSGNPYSGCREVGISKTSDTTTPSPAKIQAGIGIVNIEHTNNSNKYLVRRLTPLECERLQGFPDNWTNIGEFTTTNGKHRTSSDTVRYQALGNSIALPPWRYVLSKLCQQYQRAATMGSLFDGIGGFPLIWEELNGKGSCLWASEIAEFPMAVTKQHFQE